MSAVGKYLPFIFVRITWIGSLGQLLLDWSMRELRSLAYRTNFGGSPLARIITGLIKVLPFGCSFSFTGDIFSYCSRMSSNLLTLSCKWIGNLLAHCFLKTASGLKGRRRGEFFFQRRI